MNIRFQSHTQILQNLTEASLALLDAQQSRKGRAKHEGIAIGRIAAAAEDPTIASFSKRSQRFTEQSVTLDDGNSLADIWEFRSPFVKPAARTAAFNQFDALVTQSMTHPGIAKLLDALRAKLP